ncbi:UvrD-helicase domain-containing protein [Halococcus thailandensis]|uniref:DNA 3'-5' helicase n=1 Tax=Halococcus thailandensis JCM 13552 TaxID=1227457 RepID=M0NG11_9EURY|nr:ATP-dependent helicase [Halococcus thailandensis]EMA56796.1 repair helicase [Halococcus thailandensis JCM 13552]
MSGTHVTKLIGSPGSGKTTRLLKFAETEAEEYGTGYGELLFLTYSKSARYEATERIRDVYPNTDEEELEKRVRTVHSAALVACLVDGPLDLRDRGAPDDDGKLIIMEQEGKGLELFEFFFDSKRNCPSIRYDADTDDPIQQLEQGGASEIPLGNKLIAAYNYVRTKDWEFSDYWQTPFDLDLSESEVIEAFEKWEAFKERHDLIQHHDYQKMALDGGYAPETDVLIIDEFQDLSPLQIKLYEMWRDSGRIKRMYIAGDPHQAIYGFRGAEPMYFRREGVDEVVHHEKSWRCPSAVIDAAVPVAEPVPEHDVSRVSARTDGGSVEHVDADGPLDLSRMVFDALDEHEQIYLLARTNRQAGKIAYGLREGGVPYLDLKPHGPLRRWKQPLPMILSAIQAIDNGQHLPLPVATALLENLSPAPPRREAQQRAEDGHLSPTSRIRGHVITAGEYREWFPDVDRGRELVPQLSVKDWRRDLVEGALRSGADHHPENVRVGTIHAAKGLESPHVMLFPAYTHKQMERFENGDEAEERRLFYVAMTRASDRLDVVHSYFGGKEFPPLSAV